ncbi:MAG: hypothetical protein K2W95_12310 [Candidatus Obscuribacterales bacterium]|nr:hypothetical protein [Candidatus Obscuribacterales bacterium]
MPNIQEFNYDQSGVSTKTNELGMREMQERAFQARNNQYILIKAPPASGKSRALMFIALDKLLKQGLKKVIITVPEMSIGGSFAKTELKKHGFYADWEPEPEFNLCTVGGEQGKVKTFKRFLEGDSKILICTHATLRFACEGLNETKLDDCLLAIDEFHHVAAASENRLGELLRSIMSKSKAHVVAMTGSYFRGDNVPVLEPEDEAKFKRVTYNYYEQLNGYTFLKSLGIGYHFYQGRYTDAILDVLDTDKKTILHIPNVNSGESTKLKYDEVGAIIDKIGDVLKQDPDTGVIFVKRHKDGKVLKIADLVHDLPRDREKVVNYLRSIKSADDMDLIIALGMAKEGFDWPHCEHSLTVGYRGSLTEIIQIIGRCTRDSENKGHAQFTNLIAAPDATDELVKLSVNNMLKAITCSLLMEQVLAPNWKFKTKDDNNGDDERAEKGEIKIKGFREPSSERVKEIIESDLDDLKAHILQNDTVIKALPGTVEPEVINKVLIPKIIQVKYPDLNEDEIEQLRQYVVVDSIVKNSEIKEAGDQRFIRMAAQFINIEDLHIDLIDSINPFQRAYEILSKSVTAKVLKVIQEAIEATRLQMSPEEAMVLWPKIKLFVQTNQREPGLHSLDEREKRMAEALVYLRVQRRELGV